MTTQLQLVQAFHRAFSLPMAEQPVEVQEELFRLRHRLLEEENQEYLEACQNGDLVKIADALGDMLYVLCGTLLTHGMQDRIEAVFGEIHRSNMSKLGPDGKPLYREDGKIMKSREYFRPDLKPLFPEV